MTETSAISARRIAIVGGGVSGAGVAYHLANAEAQIAPEITVFEPRSELGRGLAYDTQDPAHRINVPAARMSLLPDRPDDFIQWIDETDGIADDDHARGPDGNLFPQRRLFGAYVAARLHPLVASGAIVHRRSRVTSVVRQDDGWEITDSDGGKTIADFLVIATSHPAPAAPRSLQAALDGFPRFIADPTVAGCVSVVRPDDRVLVVGNGLTAADIVATLTRNGHRGPVTSVSRRGLRSRGHAATAQEPYGDFTSTPAASASSLLKSVRRTITEAAATGLSWHAVIDQVRAHGGEIWRGLPVAERRRIVRHLRPFWDVHRFRVAPQVEEVLDHAIGEGRLEILSASVGKAAVNGGAVDVVLRGRNGQSRSKSFDAVVVTTGPAHGGILESQPWLHDLARNGHLRLDPTGLGIACNELSEAIGMGDAADPSLMISGPLARGTFGELMGLPQVTEHAAFVAQQLVGKLS